MKHRGWAAFLTSSVGAFVGCGLFVAIMVLAGFSFEQDRVNTIASSETPGMDALDAYRCPQGQTKIQIIRGAEDGFSRAGYEPAILRPDLLELPSYADYFKGTNHFAQLRNFDVRGVDAKLITHVEIPPKISQGIFVTRVKLLPGSATDKILFGDFTQRAQTLTELDEFTVRLESAIGDSFKINSEVIITLDLSELLGRSDAQYANLLTYLQSRTSLTPMDIMIEDDVVVDFLGLALCQKPLIKKGTTLVSDSRDLFGPEVIYLGCRDDPNQHICNPYAGDHACDMEIPLGCYKEGNRPPPDIKIINASFLVDGDIFFTRPVAAKNFKSLREADDFCAASFGKGVRVLSYHEGGGMAILANGRIPPKTRMWVDVKDKPLANCWTNWEGSGVSDD